MTTIPRIVDEIETRMTELQPLVDEHAQLGAAHRALTNLDARGAAPGGGDGSGRESAAARVPRGANRDAVLQFVTQNPGANTAQIADETGIAKRTLHSTIYNLKKRGELVPDGDGFRLAEIR